ncbi:MAG: conserved rane protein of unknown function [Nitrospira sp.]|jgi:uncharacterized membrane protein (DUF2068 family)|nr:conserved rane protein of unknown function [Nitrospira sp.]
METHHSGLAAIATFKVVKGLLLLVVGAGLLRLAHGELATFFSHLLEVLHLNLHAHLIHALILKVDALQPHGVLMMGIVSLGYAGLLLIEGVGLWLGVSWAAYMAVISTSIFLPAECYEVMRQASMVRMAILLVNLAIVGYLIRELAEQRLR